MRVAGAAVGGVAGGFALAFLLCGATVVIALATGVDATLPGVFWARPGMENDALAIEFQPNLVGILVIAALSAAASALLATRNPGLRRH